MEMKEKLVQGREASDGATSYFIHRYNNVIETYNEAVTTPGAYLEPMDANPFFMKVNRLLSRGLVQVLLVVLLVGAPVLNLFCLGFLWFYYLHLRKEAKIHQRNLKKCSNPLQGFYFLPEVCQQLGRHCTELTIQTKGRDSVTQTWRASPSTRSFTATSSRSTAAPTR